MPKNNEASPEEKEFVQWLKDKDLYWWCDSTLVMQKMFRVWQTMKAEQEFDKKLLKIIDALMYTCQNVTDLDNVYNDETGESFPWSEVQEAYDEVARRSK